MYICAICGQCIGPHIPLRKKTVKTRIVSYPFRKEVNCKRFEKKIKFTDDPGGKGIEIAEEIKICPDCLGSAN